MAIRQPGSGEATAPRSQRRKTSEGLIWRHGCGLVRRVRGPSVGNYFAASARFLQRRAGWGHSLLRAARTVGRISVCPAWRGACSSAIHQAHAARARLSSSAASERAP